MRPALVIAHRGASARAVENSLAAFRAAGPLGADAVELDIHATADGTLIVHHDAAIGDSRPIPQLTTPEALDATGPGLGVFVEIKDLPAQFDARLFDALDHGPNPASYAVHSFDHRVVRRLGRARPTLRRGVLSSSYLVDPLGALAAAGATTLWQERAMVDRALVELLHGAGAELLVWTVDDPVEMRRLLALEVDGLCTNHPDLARQAVDARAA